MPAIQKRDLQEYEYPEWLKNIFTPTGGGGRGYTGRGGIGGFQYVPPEGKTGAGYEIPQIVTDREFGLAKRAQELFGKTGIPSPTPETYTPPTDAGMGISAPPPVPPTPTPEEKMAYSWEGLVPKGEEYPGAFYKPRYNEPIRMGTLAPISDIKPTGITAEGKPSYGQFSQMRTIQDRPVISPLPATATWEDKQNRINQIKLQIMDVVRKNPEWQNQADQALQYMMLKEGLTMEQPKIHDIGGIGYIQRGNQFIPVTPEVKKKEEMPLSDGELALYEKELGIKLPKTTTLAHIMGIIEARKASLYGNMEAGGEKTGKKYTITKVE